MESHWIPLGMLATGVCLLLYATHSAYVLSKSTLSDQKGWLALLALVAILVAGYSLLMLKLYQSAVVGWLESALSIVLLLAACFSVALLRLCQITVQCSIEEARNANRDSLHDQLTGLPNRRWFLRDMDSLIKGETSFALLMIDLDKLKRINDALGHIHGDELLQKVALRLEAELQSSQKLYHLGGDEFALLERNADMAEKTAEQLVHCMRSPVSVDSLVVDVGANVGIAGHPLHGKDTTTLLGRADMAMYDAKQKSIGWAWFQNDLDTQLRRKLTISSNLRRAVADNQLLLHYQPIFSNNGKQIVSVEALLRWPVRDGEFISPQEFIPIAEEERMVDAITNWVVRTAVQQLGVWMREGLDINMNINLSALDLQDPNLWSRISEILAAEQVPADRIVLELTESAMMLDVDRATQTLHEITNGGAHVAIDDFGTGYSSMARLKGMPIEQIKIDRCFVLDVVDNSEDAAIVNATVFLAKNLGCSVTAEGVETAIAASHLRALGCDYLQGFHFARPQPAAEVGLLLHEFQVPTELLKVS